MAAGYVFIATTLDGFIARSNGELDWLTLVESPGEDYGYQAFMDSMDALVMGRNTFEKVASFGEWPYANKPVVVLSHHDLNLPEDIKRQVTVLSLSPLELMAWADSKGYQRLYIDGGYTISTFMDCELIKEMVISIIPVIIGSGIPLFQGVMHDVKLQYKQTHIFESGLVQNIYEVRYEK